MEHCLFITSPTHTDTTHAHTHTTQPTLWLENELKDLNQQTENGKKTKVETRPAAFQKLQGSVDVNYLVSKICNGGRIVVIVVVAVVLR